MLEEKGVHLTEEDFGRREKKITKKAWCSARQKFSGGTKLCLQQPDEGEGTWLFWASRKKSDVKGEQKGHCILETGPFLNDLYFLVRITTTKTNTMLKTPSKDYLCASACLHQSSINPT